jgi:hypothetical protein
VHVQWLAPARGIKAGFGHVGGQPLSGGGQAFACQAVAQEGMASVASTASTASTMAISIRVRPRLR